MIEFLKKLFSVEPRMTMEEIYLSRSTTLEEVERRQQQIARGEAPWQKNANGGY